jgi:hypothetical protein
MKPPQPWRALAVIASRSGFSHEGRIIAANAQSRTGQQDIASRFVIGGSIAPINVRRRAMPERLLTMEEAGDYVAAQTVEAMRLPGVR